MAMFIVKPWYRKKDDAIYGAEWAGTSDPSWVRTDAAVGFADPNPYYSGMSTTPSSPFDTILPWSGLRRVSNAEAGELVEIPKFYYKWTRDGIKMKMQISMTKHEGFLTSPAHADRGDGVGERDYVYVGRYYCSKSTHKSATNLQNTTGDTSFDVRTSVEALGNNIYSSDFAMWWTIRMLYLAEYAHWNSQAKIGYGGGSGLSQVSGATDSMPYHTGTVAPARSTSAAMQYRYLENLWACGDVFIDGLYHSSGNLYCIKNPANFKNGQTGGTLIGTYSDTNQGYLSYKFSNNPTTSGFEYAIFPIPTNSSDYDTYITDTVNMSTGYLARYANSNHLYTSKGCGLFSLRLLMQGRTEGTLARLMVLPPSRLSA